MDDKDKIYVHAGAGDVKYADLIAAIENVGGQVVSMNWIEEVARMEVEVKGQKQLMIDIMRATNSMDRTVSCGVVSMRGPGMQAVARALRVDPELLEDEPDYPLPEDMRRMIEQ